ncbi:12463_t:CDS:2, partial [Racocetra persica]
TTNRINEIVDKIHQDERAEGITKSDIKKVINVLLEVIDETLIGGEEIDFTGHFRLYATKTEAKEKIMGFGAKKGKNITIPARLVPRAKFSSVLKKRMGLTRSGENKYQKYFYFNELQVMNSLKPLLNEHKLVLLLSDDESVGLELQKDGTIGQNADPAKAKGAAETYAVKYILSKLFLIPVKDETDPDTDNSKQVISHEQQQTLYDLFVKVRGESLDTQKILLTEFDKIITKNGKVGGTAPEEIEAELESPELIKKRKETKEKIKDNEIEYWNNKVTIKYNGKDYEIEKKTDEQKAKPKGDDNGTEITIKNYKESS